jgi:fatty-acid desaturase
LYLHGEPWHANHHEDPKNWRFGKHWYQIDLGAVLIRTSVALKIAEARL